MQPMTRRTFVGLGTAGAGTAGLGALGWDLTGAVRVQQDLRISGAKEVRSLCPYCAVGCAIVAYTRPGASGKPELLQIQGDPDCRRGRDPGGNDGADRRIGAADRGRVRAAGSRVTPVMSPSPS